MHNKNNNSFLEASIYKVNQHTNNSSNTMARNLKNVFNGFLQRQATDDEYVTNSDSQINFVLSNFGMTEESLIDRRKLPSLILKYAKYDNAILFDKEKGGNPYDAFMFYPTSISDQNDPLTRKTYRENMSSQDAFYSLVDKVYPDNADIADEYSDIVSRAQEEFWNKLASDDTIESSEAIEYVWARAIFFGRAINQLWNNIFNRELKPIWYLLYNLKKSKEISFNDLDATEKEKIRKEIELAKQEIKKELERIKKEDEFDYDSEPLDYDDSNDFDTFGSDNFSYKNDEDKKDDKDDDNIDDEEIKRTVRSGLVTRFMNGENQNAVEDFINLVYFCKSCLGGWKKMKRWAKVIGYGVPYSTNLDSSDVEILEESNNNPYDQISAGKITKIKSFGLIASLSYQILHFYEGYSGSFFPDYVKSKLLDKAFTYLENLKHTLGIPDNDLVKGYEKTDMQNQNDAFGPEMNIGKEDKHYGFTDNVIERLPELLENVKNYIPPTAKTEQRIKNAEETSYNSFKLLNMIFYNLPQVNYNGKPVQFENIKTKNGTKQVPISLVTIDQLGSHRKDGVTPKDVMEALNSSTKRNPNAVLDSKVDTSTYAITQAFNTFKQANYDKLDQKEWNSFDWVDNYLYKNWNDNKVIPSKLFSKSASINTNSKKSDEEKKYNTDIKKQQAINKMGLKGKYLYKYLNDPTYTKKLKRDENGNLVVDESVPTIISYDYKEDNIDKDADDVLDNIDDSDDNDNVDTDVLKDIDEENKKDANDNSTDNE